MSLHPPFTLRCGDTWEFTGPLNDFNGNPLPLAGSTIIWRLDDLSFRKNYITLVTGFGVEIINLASSIVTYGPSIAQTSTLVPGTYYDTLQVTLADGTAFTVIEGTINASPMPV